MKKTAIKLKVSGVLREERLAAVKPNDWNPNRVSVRKFESIKLSMQTDGWMRSQPLLIWQTDDKGKKRNIIIDGEHRWRAGNEIGYPKAPMVFVDGLTLSEAKALTIKLDNNRGTFEGQALTALLKDLIPSLKVEDPALALGFTQSELNQALKITAPDTTIGSNPSRNAITVTVPLYFSKEDNARFAEQVKAIGAEHGLETVTEVVKFAVNRVATE